MKVFFKLSPAQAQALLAAPPSPNGILTEEAGMGQLLYKFLGPELTLKLGRAIKAGCEPEAKVIPDEVYGGPAVWTEEEEGRVMAQMTAWLAEVDACPHEAMVEIEVHDLIQGGLIRTVGVCRHHAMAAARMEDSGQGAERYAAWERANGITGLLN